MNPDDLASSLYNEMYDLDSVFGPAQGGEREAHIRVGGGEAVVTLTDHDFDDALVTVVAVDLFASGRLIEGGMSWEADLADAECRRLLIAAVNGLKDAVHGSLATVTANIYDLFRPITSRFTLLHAEDGQDLEEARLVVNRLLEGPS